ncbi:putative transcription factor WD40-like family [Rosa chinensis]|uniref:Putative transcription factor WD40-like family n=1 Tax=Rosa chinensis TaxID=74649 RepID=A0A2P6PXP3_ROSCH|nr:topless-related protein 1 isoform X1 [Rosa chinensis]PRQ26695.1 putative transcription factor WD40-like family [Rosa chinensis]
MATPSATTTTLTKDLTFLIMQFLDEDKWKDTLHRLQQESGYFFDMKYFEELLLEGNWNEVEKYLSGFTKVDDNRYSMKIFFEIRKQKYLEALDRHDRAAAVDILVKDLKVFAGFNEDLYKEITQLLTLNNFRDNAQLSAYADIRTARAIMAQELKKLVEANPSFREKLQFPSIKSSRLRTLINQSLNWQHSLCPNPKQNPEIKTLFVDHTCRHSNDPFAHLAANGQAQQMGAVQRADGFIPIGVNGSFQPPIAPVPIPPPLSTWTSIPPSVNQLAASAGGIGFGSPANPASYLNSPANPEDLFRTRFPGVSDRVILPGVNPVHVPSPAFNAIDEFPKAVARILNQGSVPTSMDFHPLQQTILLVGTSMGDISVWEVSSREKLVSRSFQPWDMGASSMILKATLVKDPSVSVKRVLWSPDGSLFGVAYSKHMMQLYGYFGGDDVRQHLEIDAHVGSVNDLAFCNPTKQLCVITCGDDKAIKVWDAATGSKLYTFEGHEAPVHSVCPHSKEHVHFVFSTSVDGQIKAWLYEVVGSRVNYDAPSLSCTTMVYSADGKRLFSCGTSKDGESHVVEWNENEGTIKRNYQGFQKQSLGVVQFDTTRNKYLAVGDDYAIKVWDMDNINLLATIDAEGGLLATPRIRFNKEGSLLAVSANDNRIKVLATTDGLRLMRNYESLSLIASRNAPEKNGSTRSMEDNKKPKLTEELKPAKIWKPTEISETARLRSLRLSTTTVKTDKISRLVYTNSGNAILALSSNGTHLLWRWPQADRSTIGKATTSVTPKFVEQASGILMINDLTGAKPEDAIPCFALSKNDSYVMSASGGKISLFNLMTFKTMTTFMSPPPVVTCLAFHPEDNNIVAVGFDDSTIHIYNVRIDEVRIKLKGHSKRVTGLVFSQLLKTLVSSGADAQIVVWSSDKWERQKNSFLQVPAWTTPTALFGTHLQYQKDQNHFLVVHETQLAVYETLRLECQKKWVVGESSAPISYATFSCDSQLVYASFLDGTVCVFAASNLQMQCQINPYAYLPPNVSSATYPLVIAANPQEPNQFAVGLTDGAVVMFEPLESGDKWGVLPPADNGCFHASTSANGSSLELQS